jgi:hypothetical protein
MRKLVIIIFIGTLSILNFSIISAQIRVKVNINSMPLWGPEGFDHVEYYYLPEAGIYYYAPKSQFIYMKGGRWIFSSRLPYQYRNLDLYSTYKVVINSPKPYLRNGYYGSHYKGYRNYHSKQGTIRDSRGLRNGNGNNQGKVGNRVGNNPGNRVGNNPENRIERRSQGRDMQSPSGGKGNKVGQKVMDNHNQGNRNSKGEKNDQR